MAIPSQEMGAQMRAPSNVGGNAREEARIPVTSVHRLRAETLRLLDRRPATMEIKTRLMDVLQNVRKKSDGPVSTQMFHLSIVEFQISAPKYAEMVFVWGANWKWKVGKDPDPDRGWQQAVMMVMKFSSKP